MAEHPFAYDGARRWTWLALGMLAAVWFGTLAWRPLYKPDEARYGEISREMVASGDWITPRLNGLKYFEKPPLQYWATALFYRAFGISDFSARLWTGLLGFLGLLLTYFTGKQLFGSTSGAFAAALLVASPLFVGGSQVNTLDMGLTFFMSASAFAFAMAQQYSRRRWMLVFWASCALAVLSKGLVGIVLPLGAIALYVLVRRDWKLLFGLELVRGGAAFLAICAPWFVAVSLANSEFAHFFFIQEHLQRFVTRMHHRYQPPWFFVAIIAVGAAPWILVLVAAWVRAFRKQGPTRAFDARLFLALFAATVFLFFSASSSKLPAYILPIFPALAVLGGVFLCETNGGRLLRAQCALNTLLAMVLALVALTSVSRFTDATAELVAAYQNWLLAGLVVLGLTSVAALLTARKSLTGAAVGLLALGGLAFTHGVMLAHRTLSPYFTVAGMVAAAPVLAGSAIPVFAVLGYDHTMPWSLRRPVTMVGVMDELATSVRWEPDKYLPDIKSFVSAWNALPAAYAFVPVTEFERVHSEAGLEMRVVVRGPRYVLVRKP